MLATLILLSGCSVCQRTVALATDVRVSRDFLLTVDMFPVAVDVEIRQGDYFSLTRRATIICGVPPEVTDFMTASLETLDLTCASDTNATAYVRPVDLEGFECENLSRNGRESFRFQADPDILLGEIAEVDLFPVRSECRRTATVTLNIE